MVWKEYDLDVVAGRRFALNVPVDGQDLGDWMYSHRECVDQALSNLGLLLLRGLPVKSPEEFGKLLQMLSDEKLQEYVYRSTPRTALGSGVYTASEYPPTETIAQHNESSYAQIWPMRIAFFCLRAPASGAGGATPLADSREVLSRIPSDVVARFRERRIRYVRNYGLVDLSWAEVFQTNDRKEVEKFCKDNDIEFQWIGENGLRTEQVRSATAVHPGTGEEVWFNQAHLFHVSSLGKEMADTMLEVFGEEDLPRNAYFGDGSPIDMADLKCIRDAYEAVTFHFPWREGDLLFLDNMLYSHGRQPYTGERKILAVMY